MERAHSDSSEEIAMLRQMLAERDAALASATIEIEHLKLQLKVLKRSQFGRSSEKLDAEIDQLELRLEDLEENEAERIATITTKKVGETSTPRCCRAQATAGSPAARDRGA